MIQVETTFGGGISIAVYPRRNIVRANGLFITLLSNKRLESSRREAGGGRLKDAPGRGRACRFTSRRGRGRRVKLMEVSRGGDQVEKDQAAIQCGIKPEAGGGNSACGVKPATGPRGHFLQRARRKSCMC